MHYQPYVRKPASYLFILTSIIIALIINIFPWYNNIIWIPDILIIVLSFWIIREPYKFNISLAFILGLIMDVKYGSLLGETALFYVFIAFCALNLQKRLINYSSIIQAIHFIPIFLIAYIYLYIIHYIQGHQVELIFWLKPLIELLLWPILANLLLLPQKINDDIDHNRPI